jgi:hypothetical protein
MTGAASATFPGSVEMIVKSEIPDTPETASTECARRVDQENNVISDSSAHEVHLDPSAKVVVTIEAQESATHFLVP